MKKKYSTVEVNGEKVNLKKTILGWNIVYPVVENGKINWKHLISGGSWGNLAIIGFIIFTIFLAIVEYTNAVDFANRCIETLNKRNMILDPLIKIYP